MTDKLKELAEAVVAASEAFDGSKEAEAALDAANAEFDAACTPDAILDLYRERNEARERDVRLMHPSDVAVAMPGGEADRLKRLLQGAVEDRKARAAAEASLSSAQEEVAKLAHALRYAGEAIDTGRSEPLFIARDLIRNTLADATLTQEPSLQQRAEKLAKARDAWLDEQEGKEEPPHG